MGDRTTRERRATILLLAGVAEARALAETLVDRDDVALTASLAGATRAPIAYPCPTRVGGFGGAEGLAAHLLTARVDLLIDATHPFAERISANAVQAAAATETPLLRLVRPAWTPRDGERWIPAATLEAAAAIPPAGAHVFLALGRGGVAPFLARRDLRLTARMIEPPPAPLPDVALVAARPPFSREAERALFERLEITHLAVKNSGDARGRTKLDAARDLGVSVLMIARPLAPRAAVASVAAARQWVANWLSRSTPRDETTPRFGAS